MGIPVVEAPSEAEAQCSELAKGGKVFAVASEDMDTLVFSTPILLKRLTDSKHKTVEIRIDKVLSGLELTHNQFVDLCILCGCDYCDTVPGIGPKTALKLIKKHGDIETVIKNIKNPVPEEFVKNLDEVRNLFKRPLVKPCDDVDIKFTKPDTEGLIKFLVEEKGFNIDRVNRIIERMSAVKKKGTQLRLDSFFK
jgi:flap endonuclease-1